LIGYASVGKYDSAIRSIKYNYILTEDEEGNQTEILPGPKGIYFTLSDGTLLSSEHRRTINIESSTVLDIPNAFTPNNDDANDTWRIRSLTNTNHFDKAIIKVYNKRGLLIHESKGIEKGWDGSFNGEILPVDTYYYTIDLKLSYTKKTYKGVVMILR
jgi:gliding motility-associated-like protein